MKTSISFFFRQITMIQKVVNNSHFFSSNDNGNVIIPLNKSLLEKKVLISRKTNNFDEFLGGHWRRVITQNNNLLLRS